MSDAAVRAARTLPALFAADAEPPLDRVALLVARDADPTLDVEASLARLDALADAVADRLQRALDPAAQAATLGTFLFDERGFRGADDDYYDPRNSYLHAVLETRRGIPISLSVLLVAVARRCGIAADGVGFPGHFLARVGGPDGALVDPFFGGRIVTPPVLDELARRTLGGGGRVRPEHLAATGARAIAARMLTNLTGIHESRGDHASALVVCDRLVDLTGSVEVRRDRARHALSLGARGAALDDLAAYLDARPRAADAAEVRALLAKARAPRANRPLQ